MVGVRGDVHEMTPAGMVVIVLVTAVNIVTRARIEGEIGEEIEGGRGGREIDPGIHLTD